MNGRQVQADEEGRFGGVDWSWERHAVCVVDAAGAVIERFEAEHQAAGLQAMVRRLRRAGVRRVAIERGDGPVVEALLAAGLEVVVVSSRQVKALRLRYGTAGNKDDRFDAFVLADVLRTDGHRLASLTPDGSGDDRAAGAGPGPQGPGRAPDRAGQPAARQPAERVSRRGGAVRRDRQPDQPDLPDPLPLRRAGGLALGQADGRLAGRGRLLRPADPRAAHGAPARRPGRADRPGRGRLRHRHRTAGRHR